MGKEHQVGASTGSLELLFQLKGVGVVQTDLETGRFVRANREFCEMVGYTEAELRELTNAELTHPDDWARDAARFAAFGRGELSRSDAVTRVQRRDGATVWLELHVSLLEEGGGTYNVAVAHDVTERKRAEEALRYQLELTQTITDNTHMCLLMMDAHGRGTFANEATERVTGFRPAELVGQILHNKIHHTHPDGRPFPIDECPLDRALPVRESVVGYEDVFVHKDGRFYPVRCNARPIFREGEPVGTVIEVQDITEERRVEAERKQTEAERERLFERLQDLNATLERRVEERTKELRQSERRFAQAFSAGPVAACITTLDTSTVLEVNEAFVRLTGYGQEEARDKTHQELGLWYSPEDQSRLSQARGSGNDIRNLELQLRTKAGEVRDVMLAAGVIELGNELGYLKMFYDVTRRKQAEAERELLRQAMDNAEEAVVVTTADLDLPGPRITYVNAAFTRMTGYRPEEVIGRTPRMFQGPETDRAVLRRMRRRLGVGRTFHGESVNYRKDGSTYILAWNIAPISDANGEVTHWVSTQHDVTERRRLEREILDVSAREQRRIAGDLHDSVQQQLVGTAMQAKRLAEFAVERAPDLAADLDELYTSVQDGVRSVRAVLEGITPLQENENGLMVALENMCQRITGFFGVPCGFSFEQPLLLSDFERAAQLYHIAQEATINAARHAHASRVDVQLAGRGDGYTLTITDDGNGMSEEVLQRHKRKGFDLMAYRARLIGAQLDVASSPGTGTTVSCRFTT